MRAIAILTPIALGVAMRFASAAEFTPNTIVASGTAEIYANPDSADIDIGVITAGPTAQAALLANNAEMSRAVAAIRATGVGDSHIQTSVFSVEAQHPTDRNGNTEQSRTTGYVATDKLSVTVDDLSQIAKILDAAVQAGANSSNSVVFKLINRKAIDDEALAKATENARHNAEIMAGAEHLAIGRMIAASNNGFSFGQSDTEEIVVTARRRLDSPVFPGEIGISACVTAIFSINGS
ncbi:MAG TPA: SIMPL domain-containing protein [Rhizomicrobium sp.]|nr:SIMPL domain-containing protein [Rhizomicrobium sp.]